MAEYIKNWKPRPVRSSAGKIHWNDVKTRMFNDKKITPHMKGLAELVASMCIRLGEISARTLGKKLRDMDVEWYGKPLPNYKAGEYIATLCAQNICRHSSTVKGLKFYTLVDIDGARKRLKWDKKVSK